jgi:hypothetical protein
MRLLEREQQWLGSLLRVNVGVRPAGKRLRAEEDFRSVNRALSGVAQLHEVFCHAQP